MSGSAKVLWCWSRLSGYMAAGWRELQKFDDVALKIVAWSARGSNEVAFDDELVSGLDCELLEQECRDDYAKIALACREFRPDVVVVPGWMGAAYRRLVVSDLAASCQVFMGMDTPWCGVPRQYLTRYRHRKFLRRVDHVVVAGERSWQYARRLGFPEGRVHRGVYCYDDHAFSPDAAATNGSGPSDKRFLYVGRYSPEKGLDVLLDAYEWYRKTEDDPWPLTCVGKGPLKPQIDSAKHAKDLGFIDPRSLPTVYRDHSVSILPSLYEPWGVVLAEAMGCGLPVITTEACGAGIDLVRQYTNGISVPTGDTAALADAMTWMHHHSPELLEMGEAAIQAAKPFAAPRWAARWRQWIQNSRK